MRTGNTNAGDEEDIEVIDDVDLVPDTHLDTEYAPAIPYATLRTLIPDSYRSAVITPAELIQRDMSNHKMKRRRLVRHFASQYKNGKLEWPKGFKLKQKILMPLKPNVHKAMIRARSEMNSITKK